jgi:hypothetical protein
MPPKIRDPKSRRIKGSYYKPKAGEWQQPVRRGYKLACCDCGLVHKMDFRVHCGRAQFRAFRAPRSTAMIRRKPHAFVLRPQRQLRKLHL